MLATVTALDSLVSETPRNAGDKGDARRSAHNPEVAGSNPAPATRQNGPPGASWKGRFHARVVKTEVRRPLAWLAQRFCDQSRDHFRGGPIVASRLVRVDLLRDGSRWRGRAGRSRSSR